MTRKMSNAEQRRAKRNAQIIELYEHCKDNFATQLERHLYIAQKVGCSHITVYKVLKCQRTQNRN